MTTTTLPGWWREVTPDDRLRLWVIGDSLAGPVGGALAALGREAALTRTTVDAEAGSGLVRADFFDWPATVTERAPEVGAEVLVVLLGANDGQDMYRDGAWLAFGTDAWDAAYRDLVGAFVDQLLAGARRVYWVGLPIMAGPNYDAKVRRLNGLLEAVVTGHEGAVFIPAYDLFQDDDGAFAYELPGESGALVTVRAEDGIHFTPAGAERMARRILEVLQADWQPAGG